MEAEAKTVATSSLESQFQEAGIDYSRPGFYDSPAFVQIEKRNPEFLDTYAVYVQMRSYTSDYIARARRRIAEASTFLYDRLIKDGRQGACVDVSGTLSRILEKEGIWNFCVNGCLTIAFSDDFGLDPQYFGAIGAPQSVDAVHAWVIAPPFKIIDLTVRRQNYKDGVSKHLPAYVAVENITPSHTDAIEWFDPDYLQSWVAQHRRRPTIEDIRSMCPDALHRAERIGVGEVVTDSVRLKYTPISMMAPDLPLEEMRNLCLSGDYPSDLYDQFRNQYHQ
jgi:hypothetical protein